MAACEEQKLQLYSYWRSSSSWRVRMALAYKGIPYEYKAVNLLKGEQFSEDFKKISPFSTVPVLVDNGFVLADSFAIMEYLEDKYPEPSLFPADTRKKALVRQVVSHVVSSIQPLQNLSVLNRIEEKLGSSERQKWAQYYIENGFEGLESLLARESGKFCFGDDFTMADIVLIAQIQNASGYGVDMDKFPLLKRIDEYAKTLPFLSAASPEKQPDAVI